MNEFLPDRIYAIGGGGIEMVTELLSQEWVLEEAVRPRARPESIETYLLDTAVENRNEMESREHAIETAVQQQRASFRDDGDGAAVGDLGDISVESEVLTDSLTLTSQLDLTEDAVVESIADDRPYDPEDWWLETQDIDQTLDFSKGVYRRRGVARATLDKADTESRRLANLLDMPNSGEVAIVVGLGGGTGAGLCIDLAERLLAQSPTADVTLFGVLPGHEEDARVRANAYATLSELEAVQTDPSGPLLHDVVLLPLDPTGYEGKKGHLLGSTEQLAEFDEAFSYALLAYYNTEDEDVFDQAPAFAPFTVAVPQVLRYSVDAIEEAHDAADRAVDSLTEAFEAGQQLNDQVRTFLRDQYETATDASLTEEDRRALSMQLETIEEFVDIELFAEEEYTAAQQFQETLAEVRQKTDDDVLAVIDRLQHFAPSFEFGGHENQVIDETDRALGELLSTAIEYLGTRAETMQAVAGIPDDGVRGPLQTVLALETDDADTVRFDRGRVADHRDSLAQDISETETELESITSRLEETREGRATAVDRVVTTWRRATEQPRAALTAATEVSVSEAVERLVSALETYAIEVTLADSETAVNSVEGDSVHEALDELEAALGRIGVDPIRSVDGGAVPRSDIENALRSVRQARTASLATDTSGRFEFLPLRTESERIRAEAEETLRDKRASLNKSGVFTIKGGSPTGFDVDVPFDGEPIERAAEEHLENCRQEMCAAFETALESVDPETDTSDPDPTAVRQLLDQGRMQEVADAAEAALDDAIPAPTELAERCDDLTANLETMRTQHERVAALADLMATVTDGGSRQRHKFATERYRDARGDYETVGETIAGERERLFIEQVRPLDVLHDRGGDDLRAANLLEDRDERKRARQRLRDQTKRAIGAEYLSLSTRRIRDSDARYHGHKVSLGVLTRATDHLSDVVDVQDQMTDAFGISSGTSDFGSWHAPVGGRWDIGVSVFVSGVFLDNLRNISEYQNGYETQANDTHSVHLHHAYRLEDGVVVRRQDTIATTDPQAVSLFTGDPDEGSVADTLATEYRTAVPIYTVRHDRDDDNSDDHGPSDSASTVSDAAGHGRSTSKPSDETRTMPQRSSSRHGGEPSASRDDSGGDNVTTTLQAARELEERLADGREELPHSTQDNPRTWDGATFADGAAEFLDALSADSAPSLDGASVGPDRDTGSDDTRSHDQTDGTAAGGHSPTDDGGTALNGDRQPGGANSDGDSDDAGDSDDDSDSTANQPPTDATTVDTGGEEP